ncbi:MAG: NUDIX domain-containing protein [Clostridia bacterium]|nr:NUDIX domain-containing protein [Clostridia bacterium]
MASDLKIDIDGVRLNVRVGAIMRHGDNVVIEISKIGLNSVVPGGRIQINEKSTSALVRELQEEMGIAFTEEKMTLVKVFENFYTMGGKPSHEIYFLYEYVLSDDELAQINFDTNEDNENTYFALVPKTDMAKYNVLPLTLYPLINN